jgi:hypothetical protein
MHLIRRHFQFGHACIEALAISLSLFQLCVPLCELVVNADEVPEFARPLYRAPDVSSSGAEMERADGFRVNLRELQAIRQSLQLRAVSLPRWASTADKAEKCDTKSSARSPKTAIASAITVL